MFYPGIRGVLFCLEKKGGVVFCFTLKFVLSDFFSCLVPEKEKRRVRAFVEVRLFVYGALYVGKFLQWM